MTVLSDTCHLSKALQVSESQSPVRKGELQLRYVYLRAVQQGLF